MYCTVLSNCCAMLKMSNIGTAKEKLSWYNPVEERGLNLKNFHLRIDENQPLKNRVSEKRGMKNTSGTQKFNTPQLVLPYLRRRNFGRGWVRILLLDGLCEAGFFFSTGLHAVHNLESLPHFRYILRSTPRHVIF